MYKTPEDIIQFIYSWREANGYVGKELSAATIEKFVKELLKEVALMNFTFDSNQDIIIASGKANGKSAKDIAKIAANMSDSNQATIYDIGAGKLFGQYRNELETALKSITGSDDDAKKIISGSTNADYPGYRSGYGLTLSLEAYVTKRVIESPLTKNVIIFCPEESGHSDLVNNLMIETLMKNGTPMSINGIDISVMRAIYNSGKEGQETFLQIISAMSKSVIGSTTDRTEQAWILRDAVNGNGALTADHSDFVINACFNCLCEFVGVELYSKSKKKAILCDYSNGGILIDGSSDDVAVKITYKNYQLITENDRLNDALRQIVYYTDDDGNYTGMSYDNVNTFPAVREFLNRFNTTFNKPYEPHRTYSETIQKYISTDAEMSHKYGSDYDELSDSDKEYAKQYDILYRIATNDVKTGKSELSSHSGGDISSDLSFSDVMNNIDTYNTNGGYGLALYDSELAQIEKWAKTEKGKSFIEKAKTGGKVANRVSNILTIIPKAYSTAKDAGNAFSEGRYAKGVGLLAEGTIELGTTLLLGKLEGDALAGLVEIGAVLGPGGAVALGVAGLAAIYFVDQPAGTVIDKIGNGVNWAVTTGLNSLLDLLGIYHPDEKAYEIIDELRKLFEGSEYEEEVDNWIDELLKDNEKDWDEKYAELYYLYSVINNPQPVNRDPLVIDLNGDGFELISLENGVYFDMDAKDLAEKTEWVAPEDGLLAIDLNGDGIINNGSELFGFSTALSDGRTAQSGFEALARYDYNKDSVIDAKDSVFSELRVWQDANSDGISQAQELLTMSDVGITGISLSAFEQNGRNVAEVHYSDGIGTNVGEFSFAAHLYDTIETDCVEISEEIAALPNVITAGRVRSLHSIMQAGGENTVVELELLGVSAEGATGGPAYKRVEVTRTIDKDHVKECVEQFVNSSSVDEKKQLVTEILYHITGANYMDPLTFDGFDAQKLWVVEKFLGRDLVDTDLSNGLTRVDLSYLSDQLNSLYENIFNTYYNTLNGKTHLKKYMWLISPSETEDGRKCFDTEALDRYVDACKNTDIDVENFESEMRQFVSVYDDIGNSFNHHSFYEEFLQNSAFANAIINSGLVERYNGSDEDDFIVGNSIMNVIEGGAGNDMLNGMDGSDYLLGGSGDDIIDGGNDNDIIYGDSGSDTLFGGNGDDDLNGGYGSDTLNGDNGNDLLYGNYGDDILNGGDGNDLLNGCHGNDILNGGTGNDRLEGVIGDDILNGGTGNDRLEGAKGNDTYIFNLGDGVDVIYDEEGEEEHSSSNIDKIVFGEGITTDNVFLKRTIDGLVIRYSESDKITVEKFFSSVKYDGDNTVFRIENIEFADGTVWDAHSINSHIDPNYYGTDADDYISIYRESDFLPIYAGDGNDNVYADEGDDLIYGEEGDDYLCSREGNDILVGGTGNDTLHGGTGNDTYIFNLGDGSDVISDYDESHSSADKIVFGEGITTDDIVLERSIDRSKDRDYLVIKYSETDQIKVYKACVKYYYFIENIEFADGTVWDVSDIKSRVSVLRGTDGNDYFSDLSYCYSDMYQPRREIHYAGAGNDTFVGRSGDFYGEAGDDIIKCAGRDDLLVGGIGNDYLSGGKGNDTYFFDLGDGVDTINENGIDTGSYFGEDKIKFGEGITTDHVFFEKNGSDIIIKYSETDQIKVKEAYHKYYAIEFIEFADGTLWSFDDMKSRFINEYYGTDGNDTMNGIADGFLYNGNEIFYAGAGNDTVYGNDGDDIICGGTGDDDLIGGKGGDTFIFNLGDGVDTLAEDDGYGYLGDRIVFGENITPDDIVLERDYGKSYNDSANSLFIRYGESDLITVKGVYSWASLFSSYFLNSIEFADGTVWNANDIRDHVDNNKHGTDDRDIMIGHESIRYYNPNEVFFAGDGNDYVDANDGDDVIYGEAGDDTIYGGAGNDTIYGGTGDDTLYGGNGNDVLYGGTGNDTIYGSTGDNTYIFNLGDGVDVVYDSESNADKIVFGEGITTDDISFESNGGDLIIKYSESDQITVKEMVHRVSLDSRIEFIKFADGTVWNAPDIKSRNVSVLHGTDGDDYIYGSNENELYNDSETFYAGAGDDNVYAYSGNDTIYGGTGNDTIKGGWGDDTYIFNLGDGVDTIEDYEGSADRIVFGENINPETVTIESSEDDIVICYSENDQITITNGNYSDGYFIENIEFADGTVWDESYIRLLLLNKIYGTDSSDELTGTSDKDLIYTGGGDDIVNAGNGDDIVYGEWGIDTINGESGNDTIFGGKGNDTLNGGEGNDSLTGDDGDDTLNGDDGDDTLFGGTGDDTLVGGYGNDTYIFNLGDGYDKLTDCQKSTSKGKDDRIIFGEGISADDLVIEKRNNDIRIKYSSSDRVTIKDVYTKSDDRYYIEHIQFADGTEWTMNDIITRAVNVIKGTDGNDTLTGSAATELVSDNEVFYGGKGDDKISAGTGNDVLYGESGKDTLKGEDGDDTLIGGTSSDTLNGGVGNDTYIFNLGDGSDTITDCEKSSSKGKADKIVFGEGITSSSLTFSKSSNDLVIKYSSSDKITIKDAYTKSDGRYYVEYIEFADGRLASLDYSKRSLKFVTNASTSSDSIEPETADSPMSAEALADRCAASIEASDLFGNTEPLVAADSSSLASAENSINNMVNLIVQDMSEFSIGTVSELESMTNVNNDTSKVQLWVQ